MANYKQPAIPERVGERPLSTRRCPKRRKRAGITVFSAIRGFVPGPRRPGILPSELVDTAWLRPNRVGYRVLGRLRAACTQRLRIHRVQLEALHELRLPSVVLVTSPVVLPAPLENDRSWCYRILR